MQTQTLLRRTGRALLAWLLAVIVTTLIGTILQTQFNLAALQAIDVPISLSDRLGATGADLVNFTPSFGPLVAVGFAIAVVVAGVLCRVAPLTWRNGLYALAGGTAILVMLVALKQTLDLTAIAAARHGFGFAVLVACGAVGGGVFAKAFPPATRNVPATR